ncbi:DUF3750 domain-containing protein [Aurantimonas sp. Leaf443]|uniref:DUF3750 domain-containing protein n=1 Tax=Aurantimonas sp. Leaf443 TaxID=1736378 RepID=UPI0006FE9461|nr:DUF3750 domain-containing protein [Aurantimonas sp. Leaf443]KQT85960.1 hypothetical protein ASG48_05030 [Aurantimonas sp. Leaf443]
MRIFKIVLLVLLVVYVLPAALAALLWKLGEHPSSWRDANWTSAELLPAAGESEAAAVYVLAARTGGLKGSLSEHSWIVVKEKGAGRYERWDKVGWGSPIRRDGYPADGRWYSNPPHIVVARTGPEAEALIPTVRAAIADYPFARPGGYRIFPGPNSNTFVAHVMRHVPALQATLPSAAVGRDYPSDGGFVSFEPALGDLRLSLAGYAGIVAGRTSGLEVNFLGLVAGIDPLRLAVKIPAFGRFGLLPD